MMAAAKHSKDQSMPCRPVPRLQPGVVIEVVSGKRFHFAMRFGIAAIDKSFQIIVFGLFAKNIAQEA
ncbi:MAG: hypothetical protein WCK81_10945 [Betaproteobacteria bacterium]